MVKGTSSELYIKPCQIAAEVIEGTPPAAATFVNIGAVMSLSIKFDGGWQDISQLASEDLIALIQGLQTYETQVKLSILNSTFAKRVVNSANPSTPAGTISETFTMVTSVFLDGVENFIIFKGSRPKDGEFVRESGKADEWTITMVHTNITTPNSAHGLTTPTFDTIAAGAVISWLSGGVNPVTWNAVGLNCKKVSVKFARSTKEDHTIGNPDPFGSLPHGRRITFDFDTIWTATTLEADYKAGTARTMTIVVKTSVSTLTISSANLTGYNRDASSGDDMMAVEKVSGKSLTCNIT